ncbi:unnamed protein product [Blepharisma stoltei]|uniref:Uncharacterized protein n=1 Tax=Blepharisma stoltei TaxID=1481888 RepID=A0AAU9JEV3_9CILI|nr:unnamed protein product [Blepharisma stoltei]
MEYLGEVVISTSKDDPNIYIWEPPTLSLLAHFTETISLHKQSLTLSNNTIIAPQGHKSLINYYRFGKEAPEKKSSTLEQVSAIISYNWMILAGTVQGQLMLWDINTGVLMHIWKPHFNKVTALQIIEGFFISASEDASIQVFAVSQVLAGNYMPFRNFSQHLMPITDMAVLGTSIFSCSRDRSFKVYRNWEFFYEKFVNCPLNAIEVSEQGNNKLYVAGDDGKVYFNRNNEILTWDIDQRPITNLVLTTNEQFLLASTDKVFVLNPQTGQKIKTFSIHKGEVVSLFCIPRPSDFTEQMLTHQPVKILKKQLEGEPDTIGFEFQRKKFEPNEENKEDQNIAANSEEIERLNQINGHLYRLWIEHCI